MKTYKCAKCGYKTTRKEKPERCNYCGQKNCFYEEESLDKLLA